jgi:hypothetical protein
MGEPTFKQVSKNLFKEMYFRLRGGRESGWTADYWWDVIEPCTGSGWKFMVEEPRSAEHNRMFIVIDPKAMEHRMFFLTEQDEDHFMEWPDYE